MSILLSAPSISDYRRMGGHALTSKSKQPSLGRGRGRLPLERAKSKDEYHGVATVSPSALLRYTPVTGSLRWSDSTFGLVTPTPFGKKAPCLRGYPRILRSNQSLLRLVRSLETLRELIHLMSTWPSELTMYFGNQTRCRGYRRSLRLR